MGNRSSDPAQRAGRDPPRHDPKAERRAAALKGAVALKGALPHNGSHPQHVKSQVLVSIDPNLDRGRFTVDALGEDAPRDLLRNRDP